MVTCRCSIRWLAPVALGLAVVMAPSAGHAVADRARITRAAEALVASQLPSGLFPYDFNFQAGEGEAMAPLSLQNIARQAGTAYGLAEYDLYLGDQRMRPSIARALGEFDRLSVPISKSRAQAMIEWTGLFGLPIGRYRLRVALGNLGLLYQPSGAGRLVSADGGYKKAWAGTTALALLAELHLFRATGDDRFAGRREAWLRGLQTLYVPGRGFRQYPTVLEESPFANGEAWLAMAVYADTFPDHAAITELMAALDRYFLEDYGQSTSFGFYHWGAMAAEARFATTAEPRFATFVRAATATVLDLPVPKREEWANSCSFVEGLISAAAVLIASGEAESALVARLKRRIGDEMAKNRGLQIAPGSTRLELGGGAVLEAARLADYAGWFLAGRFEPYVRIDFSQHCISALTKLQRFKIDAEQQPR